MSAARSHALRLAGPPSREDLYLSALKYYVEALGGRLKVRAVFGDDAVVVVREPLPRVS